jgi:hypothetical protein
LREARLPDLISGGTPLFGVFFPRAGKWSPQNDTPATHLFRSMVNGGGELFGDCEPTGLMT